MRDRQAWMAQLVEDGFIARSADGVRLTKRWHTALGRAAHRRFVEGNELDDIRAPIAAVLIEGYGDQDDESLAIGLRTILPLVLNDLSLDRRRRD